MMNFSVHVTEIDIFLFQALNGLVGRSWTLDYLLALAIDSPVVKAAPIGACFFYAWFSRSDDGERGRRRQRILLVTLLSLFLVGPINRAFAEANIAPRPFLYAEQSWVLRDGELVEARRVPVRVMKAGGMRDRAAGVAEGTLEGNDLVGFPSDHAAFFGALALGIFLASRAAGLVALAWTVLVVLGVRVAAGLHWPIDIFAGALIGAAVLLALQFLAARFGQGLIAPIRAWADRNPGPVSALLFIILAEASVTMGTLRKGMELVESSWERLL